MSINCTKPDKTVAIESGIDLIDQKSLIKKQPMIRDKFKIIGVKAKGQNLPETFVIIPNMATIDIRGIKMIVILVNDIIWFTTRVLSEKPGAKTYTTKGITICKIIVSILKYINTLTAIVL